MKIQGNVILVTGASSGIGLATAKLLFQQGAKLVLAARSEKDLQEVALDMPGSLAVPTDMTDVQAVKQLVAKSIEHFGHVDGLVNNAGRGYESRIEEIEPEAFEELFRLNVLGPIIAMQEVLLSMRQRGGGAIVNISSGTALARIPGYGLYSSTKRALGGISLTTRQELQSDNISVSLVYPTVTNTNFDINKLSPEDTASHLGTDFSKGDSPEYVAGIILKALVEGEAEYFAYESMKRGDNR